MHSFCFREFTVRHNTEDFNHIIRYNKLISSSFSNIYQFPPMFIQTDVPCAIGEHRGSRPERHVLSPAGFLRGWRPPVEVRERRVGAGRQARRVPANHRLHPPRLAKLRRPLDETGRQLQQSETLQQTERQRTGMKPQYIQIDYNILQYLLFRLSNAETRIIP